MWSAEFNPYPFLSAFYIFVVGFFILIISEAVLFFLIFIKGKSYKAILIINSFFVLLFGLALIYLIVGWI
jgi:hypothetical protein